MSLLKYKLFFSFFLLWGLGFSQENAAPPNDGGGDGGSGTVTMPIYGQWKVLPGSTHEYWVPDEAIVNGSSWSASGHISSRQISSHRISITWGSGARGIVEVAGYYNNSIAEGTKNITIQQPPAVPDKPVQNDPTCGSNMYLSYSNPYQNVTWYWQRGSQYKSTAEGSSNPKEVIIGETYYLQAQNDNTKLWSEKSQGITVQDRSLDIPAVSINVASNPVCYNSETALTAVIDNTKIPYWWENAAGEVLASSESKISIENLTETSEFILKAKSFEGCIGEGRVIINVLPNDYHTCINYISEYTYKAPLASVNLNEEITKVDLVTTYFDGLGRSIQQVNKQALPGYIDGVTPFVYDDYNRQPRNYLPYGSGNNGHYKKDAVIESAYHLSAQYTYYQNAVAVAHDPNPYAERIFEPSPLNRVIEQGSPGSIWQPVKGNPEAGKTIKYSYETNTTNDKVKNWDGNGSLPVDKGYFISATENGIAIGQLTKTITTDEAGHQIQEFVDKLGQTILKRVQVVEEPSNAYVAEEWADTYFVYDDYGNLKFVLPPMANEKLENGAAINDTFLSQWCHSYKYDSRKRTVEKLVPGSGWIYMVYDNRDRLVLMQDGNQRDPNKTTSREWIFTKYDQLNRPIATGHYIHPTEVTQSQMQSYVNGRVGDEDGWYEVYNGDNGLHGYTDQSFPKGVSADNYLTITYYDDYDFKNLQAFGLDYDYDATQLGSETCAQGTYTFPSSEFDRVKGLVTGSKLKVLDGNNTWLNTVTYYDDRYRVIQTISENYSGNVDKYSTLYNFPGWVLATKTSHRKGDDAYGIIKHYIYDQAGRLLKGYHELFKNGTGQGEVLLAENEYNELGELIEKNLHVENSIPQQSIDYRYNIRGWLESINNSTLEFDSESNVDDETPDLFGMELFYNHPLNGVDVGN